MNQINRTSSFDNKGAGELYRGSRTFTNFSERFHTLPFPKETVLMFKNQSRWSPRHQSLNLVSSRLKYDTLFSFTRGRSVAVVVNRRTSWLWTYYFRMFQNVISLTVNKIEDHTKLMWLIFSFLISSIACFACTECNADKHSCKQHNLHHLSVYSVATVLDLACALEGLWSERQIPKCQERLCSKQLRGTVILLGLCFLLWNYYVCKSVTMEKAYRNYANASTEKETEHRLQKRRCNR